MIGVTSSILGLLVACAFVVSALAKGVPVENAVQRAALAGGLSAFLGGRLIVHMIKAADRTERLRIEKHEAERRRAEEKANEGRAHGRVNDEHRLHPGTEAVPHPEGDRRAVVPRFRPDG